MSTQLIDRARAGDGDAFRELVAPHRRELHVHCYRLLGSAHDAEDAFQETLLAAWRGLSGFEERASLRSWLYQIATTRCLNALRTRGRRPVRSEQPMPGVELPEPTGVDEVVWLEPYPDVLLDELPGGTGPEARYQTKEAVSLAFVTALQLLPPRQRAVLILRDVLGFHAAEVARILDSSQESVTSALKRARASLDRRAAGADDEPRPPSSAAEQRLVDRFATVFEAADVDGIVALLSEDVLLAMPPIPLEWRGREVARRFLAEVVRHRAGQYRVVQTRANRQPALAVYVLDAATGVWHAMGLLVLTLAGDRIEAITRFEVGVLEGFGMPRTLRD